MKTGNMFWKILCISTIAFGVVNIVCRIALPLSGYPSFSFVIGIAMILVGLGEISDAWGKS